MSRPVGSKNKPKQNTEAKKTRGRPKGSFKKKVEREVPLTSGDCQSVDDMDRYFYPHRAEIEVVCLKCGKRFVVNANKKEIYTEEVKKNWKCVICSDIKETI